MYTFASGSLGLVADSGLPWFCWPSWGAAFGGAAGLSGFAPWWPSSARATPHSAATTIVMAAIAAAAPIFFMFVVSSCRVWDRKKGLSS
jgi:hypothetical protein